MFHVLNKQALLNKLACQELPLPLGIFTANIVCGEPLMVARQHLLRLGTTQDVDDVVGAK